MATAGSVQQKVNSLHTLRRTTWRPRFVPLVVLAVLCASSVLTGMPFVYMITGSLKTNAELFRFPVHVIPQEPTLDNYIRLLNNSQIPFIRQFGNSLIVSVNQTLLLLLIASMVGWGFARYEFRGKRALFLVLLATLTFPSQVTLVPQFLLMLHLGWLDNYLALIIPGALSAFSAFFMRQNMLTIPHDLTDAARIDGASEWSIFWRVGLPLSRGALSVLSVLAFLGSWNDYLWPLIVLRSTDKFTYPVGLATLVGLYKVEYGMILAGAFLVSLPIVGIFIAGRNHLLTNIYVGAFKG